MDYKKQKLTLEVAGPDPEGVITVIANIYDQLAETIVFFLNGERTAEEVINDDRKSTTKMTVPANTKTIVEAKLNNGSSARREVFFIKKTTLKPTIKTADEMKLKVVRNENEFIFTVQVLCQKAGMKSKIQVLDGQNDNADERMKFIDTTEEGSASFTLTVTERPRLVVVSIMGTGLSEHRKIYPIKEGERS